MQALHSAGTAKFALAGQSGSFNHGHAAQMGHAAALRMQAARALSGRPTAPAPHVTGGPGGVPGGGVPPVSYKAQIAGNAANMGHMIGPDHIHSALDSMASKGHITAFQAGALKAHNGPLQGPQGQATQTAIMREMIGGH